MAPDEIRRFDGVIRDAFLSIRIVDEKRIFLVLTAVLRNRLLFATSSKVIWVLKVEGNEKREIGNLTLGPNYGNCTLTYVLWMYSVHPRTMDVFTYTHICTTRTMCFTYICPRWNAHICTVQFKGCTKFSIFHCWLLWWFQRSTVHQKICKLSAAILNSTPLICI